MDYSVIIPCYNEAKNINELFAKLLPVLTALNSDCEIICINDGSNDSTLDELRQQLELCDSLTILDLSRNFGKEIALTAGLDHAQGEYVITMDADLQHPPELIPEFIKKISEGHDVVYGQRVLRNGVDSIGHNFFVSIFYKLMHKFAEVPLVKDAGDFRLMKKQVVEALKSLPEKKRFMKGLYAWVGFNQAALTFEAPVRTQGESAWSNLKLIRFAIDGIVSFTSAPLRIWSWLGIVIASISGLYSFSIILQTLLYGRDIPGYATLAVSIFFLSGVILISIGVLGEYISQIFTEVKNRPSYIVRDLIQKENDD
jgi:polyisoprenyl-phosphate glycosyltransferase